MYHGVGAPARFGEEHYTLTEEAFDRQLALIERESRVVPFESFLDGSAPAGASVLTFDDGERSVVTKALPLLKARGMVGALFVTTGWIGTESYVTAEEVGLLAEEGWTVGTHGVTHRYLSDLDALELRRELEESRESLARILGRAPEHTSLPGGRVSRAVVEAARRAGYRSLCTSVVGRNPSPPDPWRIRRMMVIRPWGEQQLGRIVRGDRLFYLEIQARQAALGAAKRALGNRRYERLRALAFGALARARRLRG